MSFISVEPQPRVVLESHSDSLLAQFDTQLGIIADRLAFFQERRSIEATYIDSLWKLHRKANINDASYDSRVEPTTTRAAWGSVRDNLERAANTQQAFVNILDNDVIKPLQILKKSKDETRMRLEEDLKKSAAEYANYAENKISKLQEAYFRKYLPQQCTSSTEVSRRPRDVPNKNFGRRVSAMFRSRREDLRESEPLSKPPPAKPAPFKEVSDDDCRSAVTSLNSHRLRRAEILGDGYDCLEDLVFSPTVQDVLIKYVDGMIIACATHDDLARSTREEVEKALGGTDTSDLRASFRQALSFSIPPLTLYRNYRSGGYSNLIFGVPLVDHETNEDNVPKVMRMCMEEVEKRGLNTDKIYSSGFIYDTETQELLRRFESERSFAFSPTENISSIALLLKRYLMDLPEPLLVLSLQEYRHYAQDKARSSSDLSLLRSRIRELHSVPRASLEALLRHLLRVASHSYKNAMTVDMLATCFCYPVLHGSKVMEGPVNAKRLVMKDLIQNVHTLFDKGPALSSLVPSPLVAEATYTDTYGSLFWSPESPQSTEVQTKGSTPRLRPGLVDDTPTSTQLSFTLLPSDSATNSRLTPTPTLLSPLLGLSSPNSLAEGVETTTQEQVTPDARDTMSVAMETFLNSTPSDVVYLPAPSSHQSQLPPHSEALTKPQSPPASMLSSMSGFPLSSATSLQTRMGGLSP